MAAPFFRGLRRRDSGRNEEKSFTKLWALDCWFSRTKSSAFFALKKGTEIGGMIVCFGLCPCQHNGTYTRNVYPATPTKKPAQILRFAESKNEPLSRKILGKAAQNALGKGTGPSNLPDTAVGIFLSRLKKWAQKSPEVVETSGLFAVASIWVQLDVQLEHFRPMKSQCIKSTFVS